MEFLVSSFEVRVLSSEVGTGGKGESTRCVPSLRREDGYWWGNGRWQTRARTWHSTVSNIYSIVVSGQPHDGGGARAALSAIVGDSFVQQGCERPTVRIVSLEF